MKASTTTGVIVMLLACSVACVKPEFAGFSDFLNNHTPVFPTPPILSPNNRTPAPPIQPAQPVRTSTTSSGFPAPPISGSGYGSISAPPRTVAPSPVFMDIRIDADMALPFVQGDANGIFVEYFDAETNRQLAQKKFKPPQTANRFGKQMQRFTNAQDLVNAARSVTPVIQKVGIRFDCSTAYQVMSSVRTIRNRGYITKGSQVFYSPPNVPRASWDTLLRNLRTALSNGCRKTFEDAFVANTQF